MRFFLESSLNLLNVIRKRQIKVYLPYSPILMGFDIIQHFNLFLPIHGWVLSEENGEA